MRRADVLTALPTKPPEHKSCLMYFQIQAEVKLSVKFQLWSQKDLMLRSRVLCALGPSEPLPLSEYEEHNSNDLCGCCED